MFTEWRLKIRNFFRNNRRTIIIVLIIWGIIIIINILLGLRPKQQTYNITYSPHEVLLKSDFDVPEELQTPIEDLIDDYVTKCNNKQYKEAFELLTEDCRTNCFNSSLDDFTTYASSVFATPKRYSIQDYSNYGKYYIYNLKLIDDIITTGLTGQEYAYYEEKIGISRNGDKLELSVNDYMGHEDLKRSGEDDNIKIRIESLDEFYGTKIYTVKITNKTEKEMVLYDGKIENEISIVAGDDIRVPSSVSSLVYLMPMETRTFKLEFNKFYDEINKIEKIGFNKIRIMNDDYTRQEETEEEEISKAEKVYGMEIPLQ